MSVNMIIHIPQHEDAPRTAYICGPLARGFMEYGGHTVIFRVHVYPSLFSQEKKAGGETNGKSNNVFMFMLMLMLIIITTRTELG